MTVTNKQHDTRQRLVRADQRNIACAGQRGALGLQFLAAGGPERDRKGIDPDGDGFACGFNPAPFRAAKQ